MKKTTGSSQMLDTYGENVFSIKVMKKYLSPSALKSLTMTVCNGDSLDPKIANEVASAMMTWAMSKGATHFTHWFQPLTGTTAEKHDAFICPDGIGGAIAKFSGKELIQGEPDASSFPSGGLRATFEARGYTAWDPTSPAFLKVDSKGATLCIPTVFCGYHGEALDKKAPLLRSMNVLSNQVCRLGELFGIKAKGKRAICTLGAEQEYFLVDKKYYDNRIDLIQTGRTLFGRKPAKHQQMEDHYFGAIKNRIISFMGDLDRELWSLGVPAKTRHNEVAPAQFELAPLYEELNLAVDHNMLVMEVMKNTAEKHGLVCLLHEKPFAGVNGSGKHNNWSVAGPDGKNWLTPGDNPHENAKFLTMICGLMMAVDKHADLLRAAVASASNDHRLGANEAPPAIISIFLGDQLTDVIDQIEKGGAKSSREYGHIEIGITSLPKLPRDTTDRNRTSPFAFTGNKFEFRAVGSGQSCAGANVVLNTIVAEALDEICTKLEKDVEAGRDFNESLQKILQDIVKKHKRILFNGDNYTDEWKAEAKRRGLPNLTKAPEALKALESKTNIELFKKYKVLSERELQSRYEVYMHTYKLTVQIEAGCAVNIAKTMIIPAFLRTQTVFASAIKGAADAGINEVKGTKDLLTELVSDTENIIKYATELERALSADKASDELLRLMLELRKYVDDAEAIVPDDLWPLASYTDLLFRY